MGDIPTAKELYDLVDQIGCCTTPDVYYYFLGGLHQHYAGVSNKYIIKFFKDCNDVILIDLKGRKWRNGKRWYDDGRDNNT